MKLSSGRRMALPGVFMLIAVDLASAQSSVVVAGRIDLAMSRGWGAVADVSRLTSGSFRTSRLILRGSEQLGDGMQASFWLESSLNIDTGTGSPSNSNNQSSGAAAADGGLTFNRRSTVSLSGSAGEIRLGRDVVPQIWNVNLYEPFGTNGVGAALTFTNIITGVAAVRASNTISYLTPASKQGFFGQIQRYFGENPRGSATADDGTGTGVRVGYTGSGFEVAVAMGRTSYLAGDVKQDNVGGYVDLSWGRLIAHLVRDARGSLKAKGGLVGAEVPVGRSVVRASYSTYKASAAGRPEAKLLAVGGSHDLSKRTSLYATYARLGNSGGSARALNGAVTRANASSSGIDVGITHTF